MSKKTMALVAVIMIAVFVVTVVVYPLLFNPDVAGSAEGEAAPLATPVAPLTEPAGR